MRQFLGGGVDWQVELERERVVPGTLVRGRVLLRPRSRVSFRACLASAIATEQWKHRDTERDAKGNSRTVTRTRTEEQRRLPVELLGPGTLDAGQTVEREFEVPIPPLGPATFEGTVSRLTWNLEIKLDVAGGVDPAVVTPIVVLQPTGLLSAGVVNSGQWGLWESVEGIVRGVPYRLTLKPVPLCLGQAFSGNLELDRELGGRLREVRLELKVHAKATVARGLSETMTVWRSPLPLYGPLGAGRHELAGELPPTWLPTVDLPHGQGRAVLDVVFDRPWARDDHIVRDVALCSTREM